MLQKAGNGELGVWQQLEQTEHGDVGGNMNKRSS